MRVSVEGKACRTHLWHALSKAAQPVLTSNSIVTALCLFLSYDTVGVIVGKRIFRKRTQTVGNQVSFSPNRATHFFIC